MKIRTILWSVVFVAAATMGISLLWRARLALGGEVNGLSHSASATPQPLAAASNDSAPLPVVASPAAAGLAREARLHELARTYARADIAGAIAWLRALSPADAAFAIDEIFAEVGRDDPAGVLALGQALGHGIADGRMEHIAQLWSEEEPAAAVAWVTAQPPGAGRDCLLARVALVRVRYDPAEAARLLGAMTDGDARDAALAATIARLRIYDPAKADGWQALLARN